MHAADIRAKLYAAYSSGERPKLSGVAPSGSGEAWVLDKVMFLLPTVPAHCSSELELALRISRETVLGGKCPSCGAVPSLEDGSHADDVQTLDIPVIDAIFTHTFTCPARGESVAALAREFEEQRNSETMLARIERAQASTRESLTSLNEDGIPINTEKGVPLASRILESLLDPDEDRNNRCDHLIVEPTQTWNALIAEGFWRCNECALYFLDSLKEKPNYLGVQEEFTCDLCRRYSVGPLEPLLIRQDIFVMTGAVCKQCFDTYAKQEEVDGNGHEDP